MDTTNMPEAPAALGLISSVIQILIGTQQVYEAGKVNGEFPKAAVDVAARLPSIIELLRQAEAYITSNKVDSHTCEMVERLVELCKQRAQKLQVLFERDAPDGGESRSKRYHKAARTVGRGGKVEDFFASIMRDVQRLATHFGFPDSTTRNLKEMQEEFEAAYGMGYQSFSESD